MDNTERFTIFMGILVACAALSLFDNIEPISNIGAGIVFGGLLVIFITQLNAIFRYKKPRSDMFGP